MVDRTIIDNIYESRDIPRLMRSAARISSNMAELIDSKEAQRPIQKSKGDTLSEILFPIPVNPSNPIRSHLIEHTFTYAGEGDDSIGHERKYRATSINYTDETLSDFVHSAIFDAKAVDESFHDKTTLQGQSTPRYAIVEGKKGVGKTHLQNYILTKYSDVFDERDIFWVRINLIRNYGNEKDLSILRWAKAQIAKIAVRYYDSEFSLFDREVSSKKKLADWRKVLFKFVNKNYAHDFEIYAKKTTAMTTMINRLQSEEIDEDIDPSWMPDDLIDEIFRYVKGVMRLSVILIIDGLDLLTDTKSAQKKYDRAAKAVQNFLASDAPSRIYSLLFLRPKTIETLQLLKEKIQANNTAHQDTNDVKYHVSSCNLERLFNNRISYLIRSDTKKKEANNRIERFVNFIYETPSDVVDDKGKHLKWIDLVKQIAKDNARSGTQILSFLPNQFESGAPVDESRSDAKYKFIESSMLGRAAYPAKPYTYERRAGHWSRSLDDKGHIYDTMFIPSIFSTPYPSDILPHKFMEDFGFSSYLAGFRVLQLVDFVCRCGAEKVELDRVAEVADLAFGYSKEFVKLICEELSEAEIIDIESQLLGVRGFNIFNYKARLTSKGERILNRFCEDISYLALCFYTVAIPNRLVVASGQTRGVFSLSSPKLDALPDWIAAKIVNGLSLMRLLSYANDLQIKRMKDNRDEFFRAASGVAVNPHFGSACRDLCDDTGELFSRIGVIEGRVLESAVRTINGYTSNTAREPDLMRRISRFGREWH